MNRNRAVLLALLAAFVFAAGAGGVGAAPAVQVPLSPNKIPQFVQPLPLSWATVCRSSSTADRGHDRAVRRSACASSRRTSCRRAPARRRRAWRRRPGSGDTRSADTCPDTCGGSTTPTSAGRRRRRAAPRRRSRTINRLRRLERRPTSLAYQHVDRPDADVGRPAQRRRHGTRSRDTDEPSEAELCTELGRSRNSRHDSRLATAARTTSARSRRAPPARRRDPGGAGRRPGRLVDGHGRQVVRATATTRRAAPADAALGEADLQSTRTPRRPRPSGSTTTCSAPPA